MGPVDGSQPCRQVEIAARGLWMARKSVFEPPNDDGRGDTTETNMSQTAESRFVTSRDTFLHGVARTTPLPPSDRMGHSMAGLT